MEWKRNLVSFNFGFNSELIASGGWAFLRSTWKPEVDLMSLHLNNQPATLLHFSNHPTVSLHLSNQLITHLNLSFQPVMAHLCSGLISNPT